MKGQILVLVLIIIVIILVIIYLKPNKKIVSEKHYKFEQPSNTIKSVKKGKTSTMTQGYDPSTSSKFWGINGSSVSGYYDIYSDTDVIEGMTSAEGNANVYITSQADLVNQINTIYQVDIDSIRNLSSIANSLVQGGVTIPGNLSVLENTNVTGILNITNGYTAAPPTNSVDGGDGTRLVLYPGTANTTPFSLGIADWTMWYDVPSGGIHSWYQGTTEAMRIHNNGYVGIGNTNPTSTLTVDGTISKTVYNSGEVIKVSYYNASSPEINLELSSVPGSGVGTAGNVTPLFTVDVSPISSNSTIIIEVWLFYTISGYGSDTWSSMITLSGINIAVQTQYFNGGGTGGGTRSGTLFPIKGFYTQSNQSNLTFEIQVQADSSDDTSFFSYAGGGLSVIVTEVQV